MIDTKKALDFLKERKKIKSGSEKKMWVPPDFIPPPPKVKREDISVIRNSDSSEEFDRKWKIAVNQKKTKRKV